MQLIDNGQLWVGPPERPDFLHRMQVFWEVRDRNTGDLQYIRVVYPQFSAPDTYYSLMISERGLGD